MTASGNGVVAVGLHHPQFSVNIGSVMRASGVFDVDLVAIAGPRRSIAASTDTMNARRHIPVVRCASLRDISLYDCVPVAVDLVDGAGPLHTYDHPRSAFYIFGPENGTLGASVLDWCRDRVFIPAGCLNLAAAVNVVLYDRAAKGLQP